LAKSYGDDSKLCTRGKEQLGAILFPELFEVVDDDYHLKSYAAYYDCAFVEGVLEFSSSQAQTY
jgi:phage terminase large subunit